MISACTGPESEQGFVSISCCARVRQTGRNFFGGRFQLRGVIAYFDRPALAVVSG
jgi:hypothetical protein